MVKLSDNYQWQALTGDGRIITQGGDLSGCVRISFIPQRPALARHDLAGIDMKRRFGRGFVRVMGPKTDEYVQCVVCKGFRFYLRCSNGTVLITPHNYELYL